MTGCKSINDGESITKRIYEKLKALSDKELLEYFTPYLKVTRPELAEKPKTFGGVTRVTKPVNQKMLIAKQRALELGINLDEL